MLGMLPDSRLCGVSRMSSPSAFSSAPGTTMWQAATPGLSFEFLSSPYIGAPTVGRSWVGHAMIQCSVVHTSDSGFPPGRGWVKFQTHLERKHLHAYDDAMTIRQFRSESLDDNLQPFVVISLMGAYFPCLNQLVYQEIHAPRCARSASLCRTHPHAPHACLQRIPNGYPSWRPEVQPRRSFHVSIGRSHTTSGPTLLALPSDGTAAHASRVCSLVHRRSIELLAFDVLTPSCAHSVPHSRTQLAGDTGRIGTPARPAEVQRRRPQTVW
ncbi:hypothetical protein C8Q77DRAFT_392494 [Trametes polyzona]|nr:hypothetical protein C8Q77DRAFT_392494 [Trametes polyzona]